MVYFIKYFAMALIFICFALIIYRIFTYKAVNETLKTSGKREKTTIFTAKSFDAKKALLFCIITVLVFKIISLALSSVYEDALSQSLWERSSDIPHYIDIARDGYVTEGFNAKWIVFFPLYPYILSVFGKITGEYFHTGSVLSMIFLTLALFVFYKLIYEQFGDKIAKRSIILFICYPTVFFATLPMSEGLFLFLIAAFMYFLHKKKFLYAALIGALASFTRSTGAVLAIPFAVEVFLTAKEMGGIKKNFSYMVKRGLFAFIIPVGTLLYLLINYIYFGNAFQFQIFQEEYWSQSMGFFGDTLFTLADSLFNYPTREIAFPLWGVQLIVIFGFTIILIFANKKMRPSDSALCFSILIFSISAQWLLSAPRYLMCLLPCFLYLARVLKKNYQFVIATLLLSSLSVYVLYEYLAKSCIY